MKHLFFFGCVIIILISISCKKDLSACPDCKVIDSSGTLHLKTINIIDSNWARQGQYVFTSDLTQLINEAGESVDELYALQIIDVNSLSQIYPCCQASFKGGELSASVYSTGDTRVCTLTFNYPDQDMHFGEFRNSGGLPFHAAEITVWLWK